jgi:hypothetical protein
MKKIILNKIINYIRNKIKPESDKIYSVEDIRSILQLSSNIKDIYRSIRLSDDEYKLCSYVDILKLNQFNIFSEIKYQKQYDCDNFAVVYTAIANLIMPGYAIGECWVHTDGEGNHAVNCYIDATEQKLVLIEPQTNEIYIPKDKNHKPYYIKM